jgi:hypothetical protein
MSLISTADFVGPITIAQLGQPAVVKDVNRAIALYEAEFLSDILGVGLYNDFAEGLDVSTGTQPDQKWIDLRDGISFPYTSGFPGYFPMDIYRFWWLRSGRTLRWVGLKPKVNTDKTGVPSVKSISPVAAYVFFKYQRDLMTQAVGTGVVASENENSISGVSDWKSRDAWNYMVEALWGMWIFLAAKGDGVYTSYNWQDIDFARFTKINMFNL